MSEINEETIARAICVAEGKDPDFNYDPLGLGHPAGTDLRWRCYVPQARAVLALVLPAIERARVEERERLAAWHDKEAKRWNAELWDRRSWGGPTMGAEECINAEAFHKAAAAAIRKT